MLSRVGVLLLVVACAEPGGRSLDIASQEDGWSEHRRRMNVRVVGGSEPERTLNEFLQDVARSCDAELHSYFVNACYGRQNTAVAGAAFDTVNTPVCEDLACDGQRRLCYAHRLLEIADNAQPDYQLTDLGWDGVNTSTFDYTVPPQSAATRAGLYELALHELIETTLASGAGLRGARNVTGSPGGEGAPCTAANLLNDFDGSGADLRSEGEALATSLVEATHLIREASEKLARASPTDLPCPTDLPWVRGAKLRNAEPRAVATRCSQPADDASTVADGVTQLQKALEDSKSSKRTNRSTCECHRQPVRKRVLATGVGRCRAFCWRRGWGVHAGRLGAR